MSNSAALRQETMSTTYECAAEIDPRIRDLDI